MDTTTTRLPAALGIALAGLFAFTPRSTPASFAAPATNRAFAPAPPSPGLRMQWVRSHAPARESRFGSTVIVGLESMHDLAALETSYGFARVEALLAARPAAW